MLCIYTQSAVRLGGGLDKSPETEACCRGTKVRSNATLDGPLRSLRAPWSANAGAARNSPPNGRAGRAVAPLLMSRSWPGVGRLDWTRELSRTCTRRMLWFEKLQTGEARNEAGNGT